VPVDGQELPVRPLTAGEILDAAVAVLRRSPWRLLGYALALAAAEQVVLYPVARSLLGDPHNYLTYHGDPFGTIQKILAVGAGTEAVAFVLLGTVAAGTAHAMLRRGAGVPVPARPGRRAGATVVLALLIGVGAAAAAWLVVPWVFWFMLTGLAGPALMVDGAGRGGAAYALGRSVRLVGWAHLRPGGLRLLGYLPWLVVRLAVGFAGTGAVTALTGTLSPLGTALLAGTVWALINAVAYALIACVDAVNYLETRMRLEGLDITLSRAAARAASPAVTR
jgi:hypothetical protein